jgi:hypothetical protein
VLAPQAVANRAWLGRPSGRLAQDQSQLPGQHAGCPPLPEVRPSIGYLQQAARCRGRPTGINSSRAPQGTGPIAAVTERVPHSAPADTVLALSTRSQRYAGHPPSRKPARKLCIRPLGGRALSVHCLSLNVMPSIGATSSRPPSHAACQTRRLPTGRGWSSRGSQVGSHHRARWRQMEPTAAFDFRWRTNEQNSRLRSQTANECHGNYPSSRTPP